MGTRMALLVELSIARMEKRLDRNMRSTELGLSVKVQSY